MKKLVADIIEAHGGLKRWESFNRVQVTVRSGGRLFELVNMPQDPAPRQMTAWLHEERASMRPIGAPDRYSEFTAGHVAVKSDSGDILHERKGSPKELHDHMTKGSWDLLDRLTFNGYVMWTYLTTPFFMVMPGFTVTEIEPWQEKNESWRGVQVEFPAHILSHSPIQRFYFGDDYLIRRHDYFVDVGGEFHAAQYVYNIIEVDGIKLPIKRRAYKRDENGYPVVDQVMVWIDFSEIQFS